MITAQYLKPPLAKAKKKAVGGSHSEFIGTDADLRFHRERLLP
jgi:hypothetical protein